jgi:hypothetical protein
MAKNQEGFFRKQWKRDGLFALCASMILGAVFIYASIDKIIHYSTTLAFINKERNNEN